MTNLILAFIIIIILILAIGAYVIIKLVAKVDYLEDRLLEVFPFWGYKKDEK